jgi:hypothetical protein
MKTMYASFHRYHGLDPGRVQPVVDELESAVLPPIAEKFGCLTTFVLVDRPGGCVTAVSLWDDENRMLANDRAIEAARAAQSPGAVDWRKVPQVERHEVVGDATGILAMGAAAAGR